MVDSTEITELQAAAQVHREVLKSFFRVTDPPEARPQGAARLASHSTCFCCFVEPAEHPMSCEHVLCNSCAMLYSKQRTASRMETEVQFCPFGCDWFRGSPQVVRLKPKSAGIRVLSLDGYEGLKITLFVANFVDRGGIRGLVELETLKKIEIALGGNVPIRAFFDLMVGTRFVSEFHVTRVCQEWQLTATATALVVSWLSVSASWVGPWTPASSGLRSSAPKPLPGGRAVLCSRASTIRSIKLPPSTLHYRKHSRMTDCFLAATPVPAPPYQP